MATLSASCHCGAITLTLPRAPRQVTDCNCSICRRYGALWAYYSRPQVKIAGAPAAMNAYSWGRKHLKFQRCARCGCITHYIRPTRGADQRMGVNARMFAPETLARLRIRHLDGASSWKYLD